MNAFSIKTIGDWNKDISVTLDRAIQISSDVFKRSAEQAVKHAVILMAQSLASKSNPITPTAKTTRPVLSDSKGEYVEVWQQGASAPGKLYKWTFSRVHDAQGNLREMKNFSGSAMDIDGWNKVQIIKRAGLARKSWMWGLGQWGGKGETKPISGTSEVLFTESAEKVEAIKRNKLGYITKILPSGWATEAATRASNKIMAQAARKMEKQWVSALKGGNAGMARSVSSYFLPEAAA